MNSNFLDYQYDVWKTGNEEFNFFEEDKNEYAMRFQINNAKTHGAYIECDYAMNTLTAIIKGITLFKAQKKKDFWTVKFNSRFYKKKLDASLN